MYSKNLFFMFLLKFYKFKLCKKILKLLEIFVNMSNIFVNNIKYKQYKIDYIYFIVHNYIIQVIKLTILIVLNVI